MIDYRTILENDLRRVGPAGFGFDQLARRRERKRRNERIRTVVLALILAAVAIGGAIRVIGNAERQLPANPGITPENVKNLEVAWSAPLDGVPPNTDLRALHVARVYPPTVADGSVYVGSATGTLYAFDEACASGGKACEPTWVADLGGEITDPPTVADGVVYVSANGGGLFAFAEGAGPAGPPASRSGSLTPAEPSRRRSWSTASSTASTR